MLNDAKIKAAKKAEKPYKLADAEQLYLYVNTSGGRLWRMNYSYGKNAQGKPVQKTLSFGAYPAVSLLEARAKRDEAKRLLREGRDPAVERRIVAKVRASETENTFETVARRWYALKKPSWAPIHAKDVMVSLERDAFPYIGDLPITAIKAPKLLEVLQRVEVRGSIETAHRLRQRCSAIFVYGIAAGACDADPAASIGKALQNVPKAKPQPSIIDGCKDYDTRIQAVRKLLVDCEAERCRASTKLAMRLIALTAVRPNELRGARWDEFEGLDGPEPHWRIPAARMKGDKERKADPDGDHLVPLARQSLELLAVVRQLTGHLALVFPGDRHVHHPISDNTLRALLIRAGYHQRHVPHGFRAAFSTIMNERVKDHGQPDDRAVIDLMLAHVPTGTSGSEGAYNRAAYMPRRRELAQEWADVLLDGFCDPAAHLGKPIRFAATGPGKAMEAEAA